MQNLEMQNLEAQNNLVTTATRGVMGTVVVSIIGVVLVWLLKPSARKRSYKNIYTGR